MLLAEKLNDVTTASWATSSILQLCCSASAFGRGRALCPCAQSICDYFNHIKSYKPCLSLHILPLQYFKKRNYFVGHSIYSTLRTFSRSNRWIKSLAQITYDSESSFWKALVTKLFSPLHLQTSVIIDEREFPGLGEVKRSPPPSSSSKAGSKSKSATAESSKVG